MLAWSGNCESQTLLARYSTDQLRGGSIAADQVGGNNMMKALQALYLRYWCATPSTWFAALWHRWRGSHESEKAQ
jgi:hypothetical protein